LFQPLWSPGKSVAERMSKNVDLKKLHAWSPPDKNVSWNKRDTLLYNLGIGAEDPSCAYELDARFQAVPTIWCSMAFKGEATDVIDFNSTAASFPGLKFNPAQILHGEEFAEVVGAVPTHGEFVQKTRLVAFLDKGKGAVMLTESKFFDKRNAHGPHVARIVRSSFIRGLGGFGGPKKLENDPRPAAPRIPKRAPDAVVEKPTAPTQALLYRLSGDYNPLHASVDVAQSVGFPRPILHGLCTFGIGTYAAMRAFPGVQVQSVRCRFSAPVLPGQTLRVSLWKEGPHWILFEVHVDNKKVLSDGAMQLVGGAKL